MNEEVLGSLETIKNFTINNNINNYHEFIKYLYNLSDEEKKNIIFNCIKYKKYNMNIKNGNLDKIYNMYKVLLHKLEYNKLNFKERQIYEFIKNIEIYIGEHRNDKYFKKYCDKYLKELKSYKNNIFIIMQDCLNELNIKYQKEYKLIFTDLYEIAYINCFKKEIRGKIAIGGKYKEYLNEWMKDNKNIDDVLAFTLFIILHEYRHLLQMDDYFINNKVGSSKYIKEQFIISEMNIFYKKFHDNFRAEKEANEFAYNNLQEYLFKYLHYVPVDTILNIKKYFNIFPKDNKNFLLLYRAIIKYIDLNYKIKIKKVDNFYDRIHTLKKEYRETHLED